MFRGCHFIFEGNPLIFKDINLCSKKMHSFKGKAQCLASSLWPLIHEHDGGLLFLEVPSRRMIVRSVHNYTTEEDCYKKLAKSKSTQYLHRCSPPLQPSIQIITWKQIKASKKQARSKTTLSGNLALIVNS